MFRAVLLSLIVVAALAAAACGDPPDKEIHDAQTAIDAAKAAGADLYAHDEFAAAEDALKRANDAVAQRDYRLALNDALDARERAQSAAKEAADRKVAARADADRAIRAAATAVDEAHARLKAAEAAHAPRRAIAQARRTIASVEAGLQKARTAFEAGDYLTASDATKNATVRLRGVARDLERSSTRRGGAGDEGGAKKLQRGSA
jgi:hypothetical protein